MRRFDASPGLVLSAAESASQTTLDPDRVVDVDVDGEGGAARALRS
jgi:hypothetical protein